MRYAAYATTLDGQLWNVWYVRCSLCRKRVSPRTYRFQWLANRAARRHEAMHRHLIMKGTR